MKIRKPVYNKKATEAMMKEDMPLEDSTLDFALMGAARPIAKTADTVMFGLANKVPAMYYDPDTYAGIVKGLKGTKFTEIDDYSTKGLTGLNSNALSTIAEAKRNPEVLGFIDTKNNVIFSKTDGALKHERQHMKDYLRGRSAGSNADEMMQLIMDQKSIHNKKIPYGKVEEYGNKLYHGNIGERRANIAAGETTNPRGLTNSITRDGLENKRNIVRAMPGFKAKRGNYKPTVEELKLTEYMTNGRTGALTGAGLIMVND